MTFSLRAVIVDDIADLQRQCWPDTTPNYVTDLVQRAIRLHTQQRGGGVVALVNGVVIGYGMLHIWTTVGEISDLIVAEPCRGRGVGTCIIAQICDLALNYGIQQVEIGALSDNSAAIRLYERLGFIRYRAITIQGGKPPQVIIYLHKHLSDTSH